MVGLPAVTGTSTMISVPRPGALDVHGAAQQSGPFGDAPQPKMFLADRGRIESGAEIADDQS